MHDSWGIFDAIPLLQQSQNRNWNLYLKDNEKNMNNHKEQEKDIWNKPSKLCAK